MASASGAPELGFTAVLLLLLLALQFGLQPFLTRSFVAKEVHPTSIVIIGEVSTCFTMCLKCCWSSSIIVPPNTRDVAVHSRPLDHTCRPTSCIECLPDTLRRSRQWHPDSVLAGDQVFVIGVHADFCGRAAQGMSAHLVT